jgi:phosphatidylglycerol---prolipoprotein diacylglyceryl transferase
MGAVMHRILYQRGRITIYSYPAMLYVGTLIGVMAGTYAAGLHGLNPGRVYAAILLLFPTALVGARLLFVMAHWRLYRRQPRRIWRRSEGGAALYGGFLLSFLVSLPLLGVLRIPLGAFWDAASVTMLTGMIFTKVGCFLNGCCAGRPSASRMALYLPNHRGVWCRRVPTQLLEAGLAAIILLSQAAIWNRLPFDGALFLYTVTIYAAGRWCLEGTREDIDAVGPFSLYRGISTVLAAACIMFLFFWWFHHA